jgi:hypothetical protein
VTNLHSLAVQACLLNNGDWLKDRNRSFDVFAYFMESGDEGEAEVMQAVRGMKAHEKTAKHIRVGSASNTFVSKLQRRFPPDSITELFLDDVLPILLECPYQIRVVLPASIAVSATSKSSLKSRCEASSSGYSLSRFR